MFSHYMWFGRQDVECLRNEWKPHEFNDYLTKTGVSAALAEAVLELCGGRTDEERPANPIEYLL